MERRGPARTAILSGLALALIALIGEPGGAQPPPGEGAPRERARGGSGGVHEDELVLPPARARTWYVASSQETGAGNGSVEQPWADLQAALSELRPGDRLVILPGRYEGPFVVGKGCADGTQAAPIEVWGKVDAVLRSRTESPVLTVEKAHWRLIGLEITPGKEQGAAILITGRGAHGVIVDRVHARDGWGDGIVVGPGASDITITGCHIHHFGHDRFNRSAATIRIEPGARDIVIERNQIHNMPGEPILIVQPQPGEDAGGTPPPAENVVVRDNDIQRNWG